MGVIPVMDTTTVMSLFTHRSRTQQFSLIVKGWVVGLSVIALVLGGCQKPTSHTKVISDKTQDVTEDLYHRLQAGTFEIGRDPFICELVPYPSRKSRFLFKPESGADKMTRISWDRGTFWVKTDDHALIVIYLDAEAILSHIQITPIKGFQVFRQFREFIRHPVR